MSAYVDSTFSCVRGKSAMESEWLFEPITRSDENSGDSAVFEMLAEICLP